jgi:hypothetical protein
MAVTHSIDKTTEIYGLLTKGSGVSADTHQIQQELAKISPAGQEYLADHLKSVPSYISDHSDHHLAWSKSMAGVIDGLKGEDRLHFSTAMIASMSGQATPIREMDIFARTRLRHPIADARQAPKKLHARLNYAQLANEIRENSPKPTKLAYDHQGLRKPTVNYKQADTKTAQAQMPPKTHGTDFS